MKTIILPGYSEHNKDWAEEMASQMNLGHEVIVHYWRHWPPAQRASGPEGQESSFSVRFEIDKILQEIGEEKVNIIAKSVGVFVALNLVPKISSQVTKIILCGIASVAGEDRKSLLDTVAAKIPTENILCIQNENDKFVHFSDAEKFYHSVNPNLNVVSKPRSDHDYPYPEDFQRFLASLPSSTAS
ncbi:hypothetical protein A2714_01965 [Candidatus Woesebacteria bacterium RIFCSPHIGHO2_01_FULL_38_9]|uniref:AB hydrolase-1 domain-containing protein n=2 Tax=Candidatus Woeseibacteriota TaxID=1752722 RepID=A0A1F7Y186_9BACT|nr:MAG: hypothetical protein A2714_01965 [Candidatus Woesebacteria bacterium RIFCSPHIGHO2_01_FULL_38_9]OGM60164.1 MAG: hypothetical protein A3A75_05690 [Candidatus Woesebacteria bacterium RIFCSPLOWO2_01_FULL_39_10]